MGKGGNSKEDFVFEYKGKIYPTCIKEGNAAGYVVPFASHFCKGKGLDIGGFFEWTYPGATPINILIEDKWDAYHLPEEKYDYIFSSHTLEHLPDYVGALEYWREHLKGRAASYSSTCRIPTWSTGDPLITVSTSIYSIPKI